MRRGLFVLVLLVMAAPAAAQNAPRQQLETLRQRVVERFIQNFSQQGGLTSEQRDQFQQVVMRQFRQRQQLEQRRRRLMASLEAQMRPGVAADEGQLLAALDSLVTLAEEIGGLVREDQAVYAEFLSPLQRALLVVHYERFQRQIENVQRQAAQQRRGNNQRS